MTARASDELDVAADVWRDEAATMNAREVEMVEGRDRPALPIHGETRVMRVGAGIA